VGPPQDDNVKHFRAQQFILHATPAMPVLIDGVLIGEDPITVAVKPNALHVIGG
jgi:diacylglycerol kinase family enzyme